MDELILRERPGARGATACPTGNRKGRQWHIGMKLHIDVETRSILARHLQGAAANVHDLTPCGEEREV